MSIAPTNAKVLSDFVEPKMSDQATEHDRVRADVCGNCSDTMPRRILRTTLVNILESAERAQAKDQHEAVRCIAEAPFITRCLKDKHNIISEKPSCGGLAPWQLRQVDEFIEDHLPYVIKISDLAISVRLSNSYFCRAFRCTVGESPREHIVRRRVERAQEMMIATDMPLSQVALDCGFYDQPHLTKIFRRFVGVSPAFWRRAHSII
jgi:AraC family transcriptional regulator